MSRADVRPSPADGSAEQSAGEPTTKDGANVAEDIAIAALELAKRAQAAGLTVIGFLLESVALEAGAEAATRNWPADGSET